ncbi:hypothetical protein CANCADRAFT_44365 [Tortispora caseinolytica NRRL Y-17796]|uniref:Uncharacterized protein n=1 Tax=Tortispora caseinolytica NRRL Y-17796 TaxID=767744 RepID=A0A1E4TG28_9ASCO|nr:hypothetical protein CANCADRAFT_44365 [Tortispora caseinolytica NRRL Y-17796]
MALGRSLFAFLPTFLLAGGLLMLFLYFLGGISDVTPLNRMWYVRVGEPDVGFAWTIWNVCTYGGGSVYNCTTPMPDYAFQPELILEASAIPEIYIGGNSHYYYLSRFTWPFFLLALAFCSFAFIFSMLSFCSRLASYIIAVLISIGLVFDVIASSILVALAVQARNAFVDAGMDSSISVYAIAFSWTSVACFLLAAIGYCQAGKFGKGSKRNQFAVTTPPDPNLGRPSRRMFFRSKKAANKNLFDQQSQATAV